MRRLPVSNAPGVEVILDASALLAYLENEPGAEKVSHCLPGAGMSTVNLSEVLKSSFARHGVAPAVLLPRVLALGIEALDFLTQDSVGTAELWPQTKAHGLSLGDRACLSLARRLGARVLTAERYPGWQKLALQGIQIETIR